LGVPARIAAHIEGDEIVISSEDKLRLSRVEEAHEAWLPNFMGTAA
jgi:hypothetical protein